MKKQLHIVLVFLIIFLSAFSSAMLASKEEMVFNGNTNEKICDSIYLEFNDSVVYATYFSYPEVSERDLTKHMLLPRQVGIKPIYPAEIKANSSNEICLVSEKMGNYHGVFLIHEKDKNAGIGVWMNISITGKISETKIVQEKVQVKKENSLIKVFYYLPILLLVILIILIKKSNKKKEKGILQMSIRND